MIHEDVRCRLCRGWDLNFNPGSDFVVLARESWIVGFRAGLACTIMMYACRTQMVANGIRVSMMSLPPFSRPRIVERGFLMAGPPCSLMVSACASVHQRSFARPDGNLANRKVRLSNLIWDNFVIWAALACLWGVMSVDEAKQ